MQNQYRNSVVSKRIYLESMIYLFAKRFIDVMFSLIALLVLAPLMLIISSFYLFGENKGCIFFKQTRVGINGKEFKIYKFRSMIVNAEERLKKDPELYNNYLCNNYKLDPDEDPRITSFGCFLRKTSLDELPQFLNVLLGQMSLVGPRPVVSEELKEYDDKVDQFLSVKPGITGFWQTNGRSNVGYPERVNIELYYVENKCLMLDAKIIFRTFTRVLLRSGAF